MDQSNNSVRNYRLLQFIVEGVNMCTLIMIFAIVGTYNLWKTYTLKTIVWFHYDNWVIVIVFTGSSQHTSIWTAVAHRIFELFQRIRFGSMQHNTTVFDIAAHSKVQTSMSLSNCVPLLRLEPVIVVIHAYPLPLIYNQVLVSQVFFMPTYLASVFVVIGCISFYLQRIKLANSQLDPM